MSVAKKTMRTRPRPEGVGRETGSNSDRFAGGAGGTIDSRTGRSLRECMVLNSANHSVLTARGCKVRPGPTGWTCLPGS